MSVFTALFAGVSGINTNGEAVSIIGDNIANVNTHGFKSSRPEFEDVMAGTSSISGLGSKLEKSKITFSQGGFENTGIITDMAVEGKGFFIVKDDADNSLYYSRAGQFSVDKDGYLVHPSGYRLQGYGVSATTGDLLTTTNDMQLSYAPVAPNATDEISMVANLDSTATVQAEFDSTDAAGTSNFSTGVTVYDSLGADHLVTIYFRKDTSTVWEWFALVDGGEITGGADGVNEIEARGTVTFSLAGAQTAFVQSSSDFDFLNATQSQDITFDFGTTTTTGTGLDGVTQFAQDSAINNMTQTGYAAGSLTTVEVTADGTISGNYTNGRTATLGQVALAVFQNEQGLERKGGNVFGVTIESGEALVAAAESGGRGTILSKTLEQSNVDLAAELIKMVIIQRGFQANSRTISLVNELLGSLVSIGS